MFSNQFFKAFFWVVAGLFTAMGVATAHATLILDDNFATGQDGWAQDYFAVAGTVDQSPSTFQDGGLEAIRSYVSVTDNTFWLVGIQKFVALPGMSVATSLSDVTFSLDATVQKFFGTPNAGTIQVRIQSLDSGGETTGDLKGLFDTNAVDPFTAFSTGLDTFSVEAGTFDLNAPEYRIAIFGDSPGIGGFFEGGANYGIVVDRVQLDVVPEPASLMLLAACGVMVLARRSRRSIVFREGTCIVDF